MDSEITDLCKKLGKGEASETEINKLNVHDQDAVMNTYGTCLPFFWE